MAKIVYDPNEESLKIIKKDHYCSTEIYKLESSEKFNRTHNNFGIRFRVPDGTVVKCSCGIPYILYHNFLPCNEHDFRSSLVSRDAWHKLSIFQKLQYRKYLTDSVKS